jgi:hypothetical protein
LTTGTGKSKVVPVIHSSHHKSIWDRGGIASCILRWRWVVSFKTCSLYPWRNSDGVKCTAHWVGPTPCLDALKRKKMVGCVRPEPLVFLWIHL